MWPPGILQYSDTAGVPESYRGVPALVSGSLGANLQDLWLLAARSPGQAARSPGQAAAGQPAASQPAASQAASQQPDFGSRCACSLKNLETL